MVEAALNCCAQPIIEFSAYGRLMERMGNRSPNAAPQGVYACPGFEQWLAISVVTDEQWAGLRAALGEPAWATDESLRTLAGRHAAHDLVDERLSGWAASQDLDAAVESLLAHGVPAARCWDPRVLGSHPQFVARRFFEEVDHPSLGRHPVPGLPYRFASVDRWVHRASPTLGRDNRDVLGRVLGLSDEEIAELEEQAVIGTRPTGL
jgi:crotonobetainyl-CoA:carnitine CoA-transferase CaiB-like acyl-CoA transferase